MANVNPIQLQKFLKGVDYPATKAVLIENAKKLGVDQDVCESLEQLPDVLAALASDGRVDVVAVPGS